MGFGCFVHELALCFTTSVGCGGGGHSCLMDSYHFRVRGFNDMSFHPGYILSRLWCGVCPLIFFFSPFGEPASTFHPKLHY